MADPHVNTLRVELGSRSYPILIGDGLLSQADIRSAECPGATFSWSAIRPSLRCIWSALTAALGARRRRRGHPAGRRIP